MRESRRITVHLSEETLQTLDVHADEQCRSRSSMAAFLITKGLEAREQQASEPAMESAR